MLPHKTSEMSINNLPDECLLHIFIYLDNLDDLVNCYKVTVRWSHLISYRLSKVKYLTGSKFTDSLETIIFKNPNVLKEIELAKVLPNLKILDIAHPFKQVLEYSETVKILRNTQTIKGLVFEAHPNLRFKQASLISYCKNIEMMATGLLEDHFVMNGSGTEINQLYLWDYFLSTFSIFAQYFPKLKRLHIENTTGSLFEYTGPILRNLEILEVLSSSSDSLQPFNGFKLLDLCPSLKSAYFFIDSKYHSFNENVYPTVQDLVICYMPDHEPDWIILRQFLSKFPNLKNLALRENNTLRDNHISELIGMLPNLKLLDVRESFGVSCKSADYIGQFCLNHNRSISIYYKPGQQQITLDWPNLSSRRDRICQGFDFMKHCFLKPFYQLPLLMDPTED